MALDATGNGVVMTSAHLVVVAGRVVGVGRGVGARVRRAPDAAAAALFAAQDFTTAEKYLLHFPHRCYWHVAIPTYNQKTIDSIVFPFLIDSLSIVNSSTLVIMLKLITGIYRYYEYVKVKELKK